LKAILADGRHADLFELPVVYQTSQFEFMINLKTPQFRPRRAPTLFARADEIIESGAICCGAN